MAQSQANTPLESVHLQQSQEIGATAAFADRSVPDRSRVADAGAGAGDAAVTASVNRLSADVLRTMNGNQSAEFQQELQAFIFGANQKGLSKQEITRTLDATAKLLEGQGANPLDQTKRVWLALSLMHNLSDPNRVDQGFHNTCNVTAVSKVLMAEDPARLTEMVCSTALNGFYQAPDGKKITIDAQSLQPDNEATGGETINDKRNYATQVFDLVSINNYWQRQYPPFSYVQQQTQWSGDTGERLLNSFGKPMTGSDGNILTNPNLDCRAICVIGKQVGIEDRFTVANAATHQAANEIINSPDSLAQALKSILAEGHPAVLEVESGNKLFTGRYGVNGGGWHIVTIDSYDPSTGQFHMSNQWGAENDQMVSIADLYDATLPPNLWAYCPDYNKPAIFEAYLLHMAEGGAGLERNQVKTSAEYDQWLESQKVLMRVDLFYELNVLNHKLQQARSQHNEAEVSRLEDWIRQTRSGLEE